MDRSNESEIYGFINKHHTDVYGSINPSKLKLPADFVVCVIGASRGIGAQIALSYAAAGASSVILAGRASSQDLMSSVAKEARSINAEAVVTTAECDLASSDSVASLARMVRAEYAHLDAVVVNSGFSGPVTLQVDAGDPSDFKSCADVNYMGQYYVAHWFLPLLRHGNGRAKTFLVVSALAALITHGPIANVGYCISKMAQVRLVEMIAEQYRHEGVLAVAVHPGAVKTEMAEAAPPEFLPCKHFLYRYVHVPNTNHILDLVDSSKLCGAFCTWLCAERHSNAWMTGRFLCAAWDIAELLSKKSEILANDLLKFKMRAI
jgi:NAD(P)-dependent dehydrogenase (short-subunit alcohol dehydrogenase family)